MLNRECGQMQLGRFNGCNSTKGLGATRTRVTSDQVKEVQHDRIVLRLTQAEAKKLPAADDSKQ